MIKFEYIPWTEERTWGYAEDVPPVESVTMTLGHDVSWEEAVCEFHNFLRASGYVIPYDFEEEEKKRSHEEFLQDLDAWAMDEGNTDVASDDESNTHVAPEMKPWAWLNDKEIDEIKQTAPAYVSAKAVNTVVDMVEEKLNQKYEWGDDDDGNTGVASDDESNTDVADESETDRLRAKKKQIYEDLKSEQTHNTKGEVTYDPETGEPLIDGYPLYSGLPKGEDV